MKIEFYRHSLEKSSNIKFHENPSSRLFHPDGRTDMTKLIVAFRNFVNASKNQYLNSGVPHKVCQWAKLQDVTARVTLNTNVILAFARLTTITLWRSFSSSKILVLWCLHYASGKHSYFALILVHRLGRRGHQISRPFLPWGSIWRTLSNDRNCEQDNSCSKLLSSLAT